MAPADAIAAGDVKYENDFGQVRENEIEFEGVLRNIEWDRLPPSSSD